MSAGTLVGLRADPMVAVWSHQFHKQLAHQPPAKGFCGATDDVLGATCTLGAEHPMLRHVDQSTPGLTLTWSVRPGLML